jgi:ribosomal-protein-alanine acetyltransferase
MKQRLKRLAFTLLGKDPDAVVVSFLTGPPEQAAAMLDEIQALEPARRHFAVSVCEADTRGAEAVVLAPGPAWRLARELRRRFRRVRVGLAPVLLTGDPHYRALAWAAFLLAPGKVLAYNARLERHHLQLRTALASLLFLRGVPRDRIFLRPHWLTPWKRPPLAPVPEWQMFEGRPFLPERRRVAVLAPYFPFPLAHGGAVRMYHLLREIAREFDVLLFTFTEGGAEVREPLLEFCARLIVVPRPDYREPRWSSLEPPEAAECRSTTMQALWERYTREFGAVVRQVEYTQMAAYGGDILVAHDLNFDLREQMLRREPGLGALWNWWRWRRWERRAFARYTRVAVMSARDEKLARCAHARVVPNGVDTERFHPEPEPAGLHLLFIGSFRHFPNVVAWRFFATEVWPLVRDHFPEMRATVVAGPDPLLYWRAATGTLAPPDDERFELHAFVPDVLPFYAAANIVIVPPLASAGTNLKTLEAMAAGRAIVATPAGSKGLGLEHGVSAWIAADARAFAEGIAALAADPALRARLAGEARRIAEREFDWKRAGALARQVLHEVLDPPISVRPACEADVADLDRIQLSSPEAVLWEPHSYLAYECRVAELDGRVAGFLVCRTLAADEAEVLSLVVDPAVRRRGIARRLLREALDGRPGTWYLEVRESNHPARKLYRKLGFEDISLRPNYYQDTGETAVVMRLKPC